jgi:hypothetical protein
VTEDYPDCWLLFNPNSSAKTMPPMIGCNRRSRVSALVLVAKARRPVHGQTVEQFVLIRMG